MISVFTIDFCSPGLSRDEENYQMHGMTSKERTEAVLSGRPVVGVPHFPFILGYCSKNVVCPVATIYYDTR